LLDRLHHYAFDRLGDDIRARDLELVAFAPHHLDEDRELQLASANHLDVFGRFGRLQADRDVAEELAIEAVAQLPRGDELSLATGDRGRVNPEDYRDRRLVDRDPHDGHRMLRIRDRLA